MPIAMVMVIIQAGIEATKIAQAMIAEGRTETTPEETARLRAGSDAAHRVVQGQ